jgi:RNA polymerase sigma-B factor
VILAPPAPATAPVPVEAGSRPARTGPAHRWGEERRLFERMATLDPGSAERRTLRDELVRSHLPLVVHFARRYAGRREPLEDLLQAGAVGLVNAVDRFDPGRGVAFSTFAAPTILGEIRRHFRDRTWAVHVHRSLQDRANDVDAAVQRTRQQLGRSPTVAELAGHLDLTEEQVLEALTCGAAYRATSLQTPIADGLTLGDRLGGEDPGYAELEDHEALGAALARLSPRAQRIVQLRFFGDLSQAKIADRLGISQMHVSRLLAAALAQLRAELAPE